MRAKNKHDTRLGEPLWRRAAKLTRHAARSTQQRSRTRSWRYFARDCHHNHHIIIIIIIIIIIVTLRPTHPSTFHAPTQEPARVPGPGRERPGERDADEGHQ